MKINLVKRPDVVFGQKFYRDWSDNNTKIENTINENDKYMSKHQTTQTDAHNASQITYKSETVASKIAHEERKLNNLVLGANGDGIAEVKDARVSNSGIAHPTLARRLDDDYTKFTVDKTEILTTVENSKQEILDIEYRFEPKTQDFQHLTDLSPFRNAVMQSFHIDNKTSIIYMTQATNEGYRLSRHMLNGQEIDYMLCNGGGHGTHNGYRWIGDNLWIYSNYTNNNGKPVVVRFKYDAGVTQTYGTNGMQDVFTGQDGNPYITPLINEKEGTILYRISTNNTSGEIYNYIEIRKLSDVDKNTNNIICKVDIPLELTTDTNPMQGVAYANNVLYWYTGNARLDTPNYLTAFNLADGKQLYQRSVSIGVTDGIVAGNSAEAEGMQFYYDLETDKYALLLGVTVGASNNRQHEIHGIFQKGIYEKLSANATPVAMSDTGGRRKPLPVNTTLLSDVKSAGSYYISTADIQKYVDFPLPHSWFPAGWLFDVAFPNHGGDAKQTLTMNSFAGTTITFQRIVSPTTIGAWSYISVYSLERGVRVPTVITKLSDFSTPGMTAYMTTEDSMRMKDFPRNDGVAGWYIENSMADTAGGIVQSIKRSSSNEVEIYMRTVTGAGTANRWSIIKPELV
ncbi:phage baseplate protein [Brochothrix thermosphacta]|uniref:phage baseplate protein n=1 Tax=Brochothrix thermosphacta TaxID=2756 RepID=UPI00265D56A8|nr:hypothetical protein [Brochothrix thermosphacta]WKK68285.1 hypothetical protein Q0G00_08145 [Brochothrix thermosphacta]